VLFVGEAVTLAHVARPFVLAAALDPERYEPVGAWDDRFDHLLGPAPFARKPLGTIPSDRFQRALAKGSPIYSQADLVRYVEEDLELLAEVEPDVVVGDFRLSLAVSARVAGIPYVTITNAYWTPYSLLPWPVPELPFVRPLGVRAAQAVFDLGLPISSAIHARPLRRVRRRHGLEPGPRDLRHTYTSADWVCLADLPGFVPLRELPADHRLIGPILWSPPIPPPEWWDDLPTDRPVVYVSMGGSGAGRVFPAVVEALADLELTAVVATIGTGVDLPGSERTFVTDFLPGELAVARADLVVCNGGSPQAYQALAAG
jgi:UDP:flavonoid glycosyltransferase YjiC (YdhE family)